MAARLNPKHDARTRDKIKVSQLINLLQNNAEGKVELDSVRQKSIEILLRKALPDLSSVEHTGDALQPFAIIPQVIEDVSAWQDTFTPVTKTEH